MSLRPVSLASSRSTVSDFDLRTVVRSVLDSSNSANLGSLAEAVYDRIDPANHAEALRQTLRGFVRQMVSEQRPDLAPPLPPASAPSIAGGQVPSAKVAAIRDGWQRALRSLVYVGAEHKQLAACTAADLLFAAEYRREQAAANRRRASQFDALRQHLDEHGVATVGDLPAEVLVISLGAVA